MSISINNLTKRYFYKVVFYNLNYKFEDKKKYYLKGKNGAGKSTLIKCILNQIQYEGEIRINGIISYCPDNFVFPSGVTLYSFIKTFSTLNDDIENFDTILDDMLDKFNMKKCKYSLIGSMSKGQKEKINIINALMTPSDILIMDEPFSGLDDESVKTLKDILNSKDKLIIVVSHLDCFDKTKYKCIELDENEIIEVS